MTPRQCLPWLLLCAALGASACDMASAPQEAPAVPGVPGARRAITPAPTRGIEKVDGARARELIASGGVLVDVRAEDEFNAGHLEGARHLPLDKLAGQVDAIGDRDTPVIVYCESGGRSARAASMLRRVGFKQVYDLGAMSTWH